MDVAPTPEPLTLPKLAIMLSELAVRSTNTIYGRNPESCLMQIDQFAAELDQHANAIPGGKR